MLSSMVTIIIFNIISSYSCHFYDIDNWYYRAINITSTRNLKYQVDLLRYC